MEKKIRSLEEQREEFSKGKFLATPLSGLIVWLLVGLAGLFLPARITVWVLFIGTGSIVYLALFLSKFTGENFLDKQKPKNEFDKLFFFTVGQAVLVYAIAIPFFLIDYTSSANDGRNFNRDHVAALFLDNQTLGGGLSCNKSDDSCGLALVFIARTTLCGHSLCYCIDLHFDLGGFKKEEVRTKQIFFTKQ